MYRSYPAVSFGQLIHGMNGYNDISSSILPLSFRPHPETEHLCDNYHFQLFFIQWYGLGAVLPLRLPSSWSTWLPCPYIQQVWISSFFHQYLKALVIGGISLIVAFGCPILSPTLW